MRRPPSRPTSLLTALAGLLLFPSIASAQSPTTDLASPAALREAEQRFEEGKALFGQRRFSEAHLKFSQACAVHRTINCPKNLGLVEFELGRFVDSATHLREFLQSVRASGPAAAGMDADQVAQVQKKYTEAFVRCGHIEVSAPAGARLFIEGRAIGTAPFTDTIDVPAGEHTLEAYTDHGIMRQTVKVGPGEVAPVRFGASDPVAGGEGKRQGPPPDQPGSSSARTITLVSMYGVALIGAGIGVGLLVHGEARSSDADNIRSGRDFPPGGSSACTGISSDPCAQLRSLADTYDNDRKWATVSFIGAGVVAAAATTVFFLWRPPPREDPSRTRSSERTTGRVVPLVSPGMGGVGYVGSF
ncbi:hypothetical protein [Pendulispora albinea]|uniref:PEGA domain-containing protein n=1 Tax=Pendulispora albinea TaxID=2741071 RepID=A0ABZ2LRW0_9BACT